MSDDNKIWVKAAHASAQFYQDMFGEIEHVIAPTDPESHKQVPAPMLVTDTIAVRRALTEIDSETKLPTRIVRCTDEEVKAHLKAHPELVPAGAEDEADGKASKKKAGKE